MRGFVSRFSSLLVLALMVAACGTQNPNQVENADANEKIACVGGEIPSLEGQTVAEFVEARRPEMNAAVSAFYEGEKLNNLQVIDPPALPPVASFRDVLAPSVIDSLGFKQNSICEFDAEELTTLGLVAAEVVRSGLKDRSLAGFEDPITRQRFLEGAIDHVVAIDLPPSSLGTIARQVNGWVSQSLGNGSDLDKNKVRQDIESLIPKLKAT